ELKTIGLQAQRFLEVQGLEGVRVLTVMPDGSIQTTAPAPPAASTGGALPGMANLPGWIRVEGGGRYEPGQGVAATGGVSFQLAGGHPQLFSLRAGGTAAGALGNFSYHRDFLFFDTLRHRLGVNVNGSSETDNHRVLAGLTTDERRWSAVARADLELI